TVENARKQLVLRTFASTGGDSARTAKLLGVDAEDVRRDLLALVNDEEESGNGSAPPGVAKAGSPAKKPLPKKK
ncbi:MAG: hypothetical protein ACREBE_08575, partial [bacterium]